MFEQAFKNIDDALWVNNHAQIPKFHHMAAQGFAKFYLASAGLDGHINGAARVAAASRNYWSTIDS